MCLLFNPVLCANSWEVRSATLRACLLLSPSGSSSSRWSGRTSATSMSAWYLRCDPVTLCYSHHLKKKCLLFWFDFCGPQPQTTGEQKTKPTQSSVRELRGLGLSPDLVSHIGLFRLCMSDVVCPLLAVEKNPKKHWELLAVVRVLCYLSSLAICSSSSSHWLLVYYLRQHT